MHIAIKPFSKYRRWRQSRRSRATWCRTQEMVSGLRDVLRELRLAEQLTGENKVATAEGRQRFVVTASFLAKSWRFVCGAGREAPGRQGDEVFHYAVGVPVDPTTFLITEFVGVEFSAQSSSFLKVSDASNIRALEWLDDWGLALGCHFHSHPGFGAGATRPSATDRRFQERLERGGHVAVGGIFSRDGYLRFFGGEERGFVVDVQGRHIREIEEHVYKLEMGERDISMPAGVSVRAW